MKNKFLIFLVFLLSICLFHRIRETIGIELEVTLNLSTDLLYVVTGNRTSFITNVKNTGTKMVESVNISLEGIPLEWIDVLPTISDIQPGETQGYLLVIDVPKDVEVGMYSLELKATNDVESNTETMILIVGKNMKEIADFLLKELEDSKSEAEESLLVEECVDVSIVKTFHKESELAFENGKEEYQRGDYIKAINWFEHAVPIERDVIQRVDTSLETEIKTLKSSRIIIPPFFNSKEQFQFTETYLSEKNYKEICGPIKRIKNLIMIGLVFWPGIVLLLIVLITVIVILWKRGKREERAEIMERLRERLDTESSSTLE